MKLREQQSLKAMTREEHQEQTVESIRELEQQHDEGVIETPAYLMKKRALVRML